MDSEAYGLGRDVGSVSAYRTVRWATTSDAAVSPSLRLVRLGRRCTHKSAVSAMVTAMPRNMLKRSGAGAGADVVRRIAARNRNAERPSWGCGATLVRNRVAMSEMIANELSTGMISNHPRILLTELSALRSAQSYDGGRLLHGDVGHSASHRIHERGQP